MSRTFKLLVLALLGLTGAAVGTDNMTNTNETTTESETTAAETTTATEGGDSTAAS
eukprot:CAMPEP_0170243478 /NCGR_PEP_ID=MMETSP0116_2-20130129/21515_1 /TAXON_ID=400756 /ORGANISM="Durinskia baltica, Strain CSIRO CS-38" /LENGTH=55 /DNA_ID=CAMNT_0010494333 /DNA_START=100 /DNA_END=264 /DNA_ORIENTATION=-